MSLVTRILRRTTLAMLVLGGAMTLGASPATAGDPPKAPTKTAPTVKVTPKLDLSKIQPLTNSQLAKRVTELGFKIEPQQLREPVELTPRRPWLDSKTFLRFTGDFSPNLEPPQIALRTGWYESTRFNGGYLRVHFTAAPDTTYVVDCSVTGGMVFTAALGDGTKISANAREGHFVFAFAPKAARYDAFAHIYSNNHWQTSGCKITPAS